MFFSQGLWLHSIIESPMNAFRKTKDKGLVALRFDEDKALWRDSATLLNLRQPDKSIVSPAIFDWIAGFIEDEFGGLLKLDQMYRYLAIGLKTDDRQVAAILFHRYEHMPLPLTLLKNEHLIETLQNGLADAEEVGKALDSAGWELTKYLVAPHASIEDELDQNANDSRRKLLPHLNLRRRYWASLEVPFRQFIQDLSGDSEMALNTWRDTVINTARHAFVQASAGFDDPIRGLKAVVLARRQLERRLKKIKSGKTN